MGEIPRWALTHQMVVEPYLGMTGSSGPQFGEPVTVRCHVEDSHRAKHSTNGRDVGEEGGTAWCQLRHAGIVTTESRVTIFGRQVEVRRVRRREFHGADTPNHLEVSFT